MDSLALLMNRRSIPSRLLSEPGPNPQQLQILLTAAIRVPDHGKLTPWRLLLIRGDNRPKLGEFLASAHKQKDPQISSAVFEKDRQRFNSTPIIIAVIAKIISNNKIPEQEQLLSAGCVTYNLLLGAQALGFGAQWLTGWAAYDQEVKGFLNLQENERIIGFVHIGTAREQPPERERPEIETIVSEWQPESFRS